MRSTLAAMAFLIVGLSPAWAIVGLGTSNQIFTLTGVGPDSSGNGQSHIGWGTCSFDGTNTNCTLSGAYTGLGDGGNYSFVLSYPGKGAISSGCHYTARKQLLFRASHRSLFAGDYPVAR